MLCPQQRASWDSGFRVNRSLVKVAYPQARGWKASKEKSSPCDWKVSCKLGTQFQEVGVGWGIGRGMVVQQLQCGPDKRQLFSDDPEWNPSRGRNDLSSFKRHFWGQKHSSHLSGCPLVFPLSPFSLLFLSSAHTVDPVWTLNI